MTLRRPSAYVIRILSDPIHPYALLIYTVLFFPMRSHAEGAAGNPPGEVIGKVKCAIPVLRPIPRRAISAFAECGRNEGLFQQPTVMVRTMCSGYKKDHEMVLM